MCDSFESPRKLYVWDLEGSTAFTVGTLVEANWPAPETGRTGLQAHFTPDGQPLLLLWHQAVITTAGNCLLRCSQGLPAHELQSEQRGGMIMNKHIFGSLNSV